MAERLRHVVEAQQFDRPLLEHLFSVADDMKKLGEAGKLPTDDLRGKIIATLFYEPSTRTRLSFESAAHRLGADVLTTDNASVFSSAAKGETIEDTVKVMSGYADALVMRSKEEGYAKRAATVDAMPVINAGDGTGQHPTQALLDLYTIKDLLGRIDGLKVAIVGDLKNGRTVHSLAYLLGKFDGLTINFIAPKQVQITDNIVDYGRRHGVNMSISDDLASTLPDADCVYMTRIQKERMTPAEYEEVKGAFVLTPALVNSMKENSIILHPLPRVDEIPFSVDSDKRAKYFEQAKNGLYVRMALLKEILK